MIDVVSGVVIRGGRVFLTQRRVDQSYPMLYEPPGGKVESGETLRAALLRELSEELEVWSEGPEDDDRATPEQIFFVTEFERGVVEGVGEERSVRISFFLVGIRDGLWPVGGEGQGSGWFSIPEVRALRLLPGIERARETIEREMSR